MICSNYFKHDTSYVSFAIDKAKPTTLPQAASQMLWCRDYSVSMNRPVGVLHFDVLAQLTERSTVHVTRQAKSEFKLSFVLMNWKF